MIDLNMPGLQMGQPTEDDIRAQLAAQAAPTPQYSLGGFLGNAVSDAGNVLKGIAGLPKLLYDFTPVGQAYNTLKSFNPQNGTRTQGNQVVNDVTNIGKGLANEYSGLVTDPINHVYQSPISSILDVLPFAQAGKAALGGKAAEAGKAAEVADASATPTAATKLYSSPFGVTPSQAKYLHPIDTFNEMIQHGVNGSLSDIQSTINKVTGATGVLPKMVRQAVGAIPGEINIADLPGMINEQLSQIPGLTDRNVEAHMTSLHKMLQTGQSEGIGAIAPLDSLDAIKSLQAKAAEYFKKPYSELNHSLGDVYTTAANELRDRLDQAATQSNVIAPNADKITNELSNISPRLAQQFAANPTVGTLRSIQAPFVRMSQILDSTAAGAASKSTQLVHALNRGVLAAGGMATGGIAGALLSQMAEPLLSAGTESVMPKIMTGLGTAAANVGNGVDAVKGASIPTLQLGRVPSLGADTSTATAPAVSGMPATALASNTPQWQVSADGQYKTDPSTGVSYSMDDQWQYDPNQQQWVPNQSAQSQGQNGLPSISDIEAAMVNDMKTTGGVQMSRLNDLLQAAQYQQSQYGGEVQAGSIAAKNAQTVAQQAAQMFLGAGANPQTGLGGTGGVANSGMGTGVASGALRQIALTLGGKNLDSNAANYNTWADNASYQIAAALNGGYDKVTAQNEKMARDLLPTLSDSPQTAAQKINQVMQYIQQSQANYTTSTPAQIQAQSQGLPPVNQMLGGQ